VFYIVPTSYGAIIRSPKESKGSGMQSRSTANVRHYRCSCSLLGGFLCYFRFLLESRQSCAAMEKTDRALRGAKELVNTMMKIMVKHNSYKQSSELMVQAAVFLAFFTCRLSAKRDLTSEQHQHATLVTQTTQTVSSEAHHLRIRRWMV